jgi:hypothetical protein
MHSHGIRLRGFKNFTTNLRHSSYLASWDIISKHHEYQAIAPRAELRYPNLIAQEAANYDIQT